MRNVIVEWRNEWEYCLVFRIDDAIKHCVYTQKINPMLIVSWVKFGIAP